MKIFADAREYIKIPYTADFTPEVVEIEIDDVWYPVENIGPPALFLVAGEEVESNPGGTIVLPLGKYYMRIRATDAPEIIVRDVPGFIEVVPSEPKN
jgi:hypothetical protein